MSALVSSNYCGNSLISSYNMVNNSGSNLLNSMAVEGERMHLEATRISQYYSYLVDLSCESAIHVTSKSACSFGSLHSTSDESSSSSHSSSRQTVKGLPPLSLSNNSRTSCHVGIHVGLCEPLPTLSMEPIAHKSHPPLPIAPSSSATATVSLASGQYTHNSHHHHHHHHLHPLLQRNQYHRYSAVLSEEDLLMEEEETLTPSSTSPQNPLLPLTHVNHLHDLCTITTPSVFEAADIVTSPKLSSKHSFGSSPPSSIASLSSLFSTTIADSRRSPISVASSLLDSHSPTLTDGKSSPVDGNSAYDMSLVEQTVVNHIETEQIPEIKLEEDLSQEIVENGERGQLVNEANSLSVSLDKSASSTDKRSKTADTTPRNGNVTTATSEKVASRVGSSADQTDNQQFPSLNNATQKLRQKQSSHEVPKFYFPGFGSRPPLSVEEIENRIRRISHEFYKGSLANADEKNPQLLPISSLPTLMQVLNLPLYWKIIVYCASGGADNKPINKEAVLTLWKKVLTSCTDEASKFIYLLTKGQSQYLLPQDFHPLIQDILQTHPGLAFLESAKDFHSRYVTTVTARIFFCVNNSWSGRISLPELRRSDFLSVLASLQMEDDINMVTQYFSYEHFYVIYCKFWELDEDHDLIITKQQLARHGSYAISSRMIDRIFSGAVFKSEKTSKGEIMTYSDFVWFLLAEEDKRHPRSIEYWFRCMDLDGDGVISMYEMEYFYSEQLAKMDELSIEPIPFEDCLCQMLDMVSPSEPNVIRLSDLKRCKMCHIFFDTFFNLMKYIEHEQRDPFSNAKDAEDGLNEISDWDRFASEAYEALVAEDGAQNADDIYESDFEPEDASDYLQQAAKGVYGSHNSQNNNSSSVLDAMGLEFPSLRSSGATSGVSSSVRGNNNEKTL